MSGKAMQRISMYFHRQLLAMIDECIRRAPPKQVPWTDWEEAQSRSEWIREACRQRIQAEAKPMAGEGQP
jgi:metal-responsive CopG/Arc/MetJ family transcriptional regulator